MMEILILTAGLLMLKMNFIVKGQYLPSCIFRGILFLLYKEILTNNTVYFWQINTSFNNLIEVNVKLLI